MKSRSICISDGVTLDNFRGQFSIFKCKIGMTFEEAMHLLHEQHITFKLSEGHNYKEISTSESLQSFYVKNDYERYDLVIYGDKVIEGFCFNWWKDRGLYVSPYIPYADENLLAIKEWLSGKLKLPYQVKTFSREKISVIYVLRNEVILIMRTPEDCVIDICSLTDYQQRNQGLIQYLCSSLKHVVLRLLKMARHNKRWTSRI